MTFLGFAFFGPHRHIFTKYIDPAIKRMIADASYTRVTLIIGWGFVYVPILLFSTACVKHLDIGKAWDVLMIKFKLSFTAYISYYGLPLGILYAFLPKYIGIIMTTAFAFGWTGFYSWIYHNFVGDELVDEYYEY